MGQRSTGRKLAVQLVYQAEVQKQSIEPVIEVFEDETDYQEKTMEWTIELAKLAWAHREEVDEIIKTYSVDWDIDRINMIDRSILRVALSELLFTGTHLNVVLNEAIEIAKKYSTEDSPKFINGILGNYVEQQKKCSPES